MEIDIPGDLQAPSTSRNLLPRSRAVSLARSEAAGAASISRPGSRNSSRSFQGEMQTGQGSSAFSYGISSRSSKPSQTTYFSPVEVGISDDLSVPSTSRNPLPRSRAASLVHSEVAGSAAGSRPGSRDSSRSFQPFQGDITARESAGIRGGISRETYGMHNIEQDSPVLTMGQGNGGQHSSGYYYQLQQTRPMGHPTHSEYDPFQNEASWPGHSFEASLAVEEDGSAASRRKRKRSGTPETSYSFSGTDHPSSWQTPSEMPPLRLAFERGSTSGSGSGSGSRSAAAMGFQSARFDLPSDTSSEQLWTTESDEVAGLLLGGDQSSQLSSSSGPSSQEHPPKIDRKGKGKARAKTPDPESVIEISDSPPAPAVKAEAPPARPASTSKPVLDPFSSYTCPICFSPPVNATLTPCGHICCGACLFAALKTTMQRATTTYPGVPEARCPVCRAIIPGWDGKGGGVIGLKARAIFRL
ncbi:hypothetical protein CVT25_002354 [Psilocybe cyanescens]|uniref:RING-type domain-containing protein n=1 Tax=Psilocybe cyanescens TaxID=93625 RepID=A0A409WKI5_PSICY|nr:hypothetical protein CVT25_002354 [Psilocybe cyanescens]